MNYATKDCYVMIGDIFEKNDNSNKNAQELNFSSLCDGICSGDKFRVIKISNDEHVSITDGSKSLYLPTKVFKNLFSFIKRNIDFIGENI